jgi:DNA-directed RNA polymerase specialized sigma24 family protein
LAPWLPAIAAVIDGSGWTSHCASHRRPKQRAQRSSQRSPPRRWSARLPSSPGSEPLRTMSADASPEDRELLQAWRGGDRARGNELFRRHVAEISRFVRTKVPDHAEDLTQSTFLALLKSEAGYRGESLFRAGLFGLASLQLLQHFRSTGRGKEQFDPLTCSVIDGGASPARLVCRHEQQAADDVVGSRARAAAAPAPHLGAPSANKRRSDRRYSSIGIRNLERRRDDDHPAWRHRIGRR